MRARRSRLARQLLSPTTFGGGLPLLAPVSSLILISTPFGGGRRERARHPKTCSGTPSLSCLRRRRRRSPEQRKRETYSAGQRASEFCFSRRRKILIRMHKGLIRSETHTQQPRRPSTAASVPDFQLKPGGVKINC
jgi:hypothetical protein